MVKVNGTGCCRAAWGQMEWMFLTCLPHLIGVMQAVDGGQMLHSYPYPRLHPATTSVHHDFVFPPLSAHACTATPPYLLK